METQDKDNQSDHTLLMVISSKMDDIRNDIREIKDEMKFKVHVDDFRELKQSFEEHKKETSESIKEHSKLINAHAVKIGIGASLLTGLSWLLSYFK